MLILKTKKKQFVYFPLWVFFSSFVTLMRWQSPISWLSKIWLLKKYERKKINLYIFWLPIWSLYRNLAIFLDFFGFPWTFLPTCSWKLKLKNYHSTLAALAQIIYSLILTFFEILLFTKTNFFVKEKWKIFWNIMEYLFLNEIFKIN
jgi:hypothetical protein